MRVRPVTVTRRNARTFGNTRHRKRATNGLAGISDSPARYYLIIIGIPCIAESKLLSLESSTPNRMRVCALGFMRAVAVPRATQINNGLPYQPFRVGVAYFFSSNNSLPLQNQIKFIFVLTSPGLGYFFHLARLYTLENGINTVLHGLEDE